MRELGKIKWFGGQSRDGKNLKYGFIQRNDGTDIFVHKRNVLCNTDQLYDWTFVTFIVDSDPKTNKQSAVKVDLLENETDSDLLKNCAQSESFDVYSKAAKNYLLSINKDEAIRYIENKLNTIDSNYDKSIFVKLIPDQFYPQKSVRKYLDLDSLYKMLLEENEGRLESVESISELAQKLSSLSKYNVDDFLNKLPPEFIYKHETLRILLTPDARIRMLVKYYEENINQEAKDNIICEIASLLLLSTDYSHWTLISDDLLSLNIIWKTAPNKIKLTYLLKIMQNAVNDDIERIMIRIEGVLSNSGRYEINELLSLLPEEIQYHNKFFKYYSGIKQVNYYWEEILNNNLPKWNLLNQDSKVLAIYRSLKEKVSLTYYLDYEDSEVIKRLLKIISQDIIPVNKEILFNELHILVMERISSIAWDLNQDITSSSFFPKCNVYNINVEYCEGRPWPTENDKNNNTISRIFCPRTGKECSLTSARIFPDINLSWEKWSLMEFYEYMQINTLLPGLNNGHEYIPKLSGWVNRLIEIRKRLKCSVCEEIMIPEMEYAKNLAKYNVTIVSCSKGNGHDHNIYLNHCWACSHIIDSRESKIQYEGFYLCMHCGSGPMQSSTFSQGNICPKCGDNSGMSTQEYYSRLMSCNICFHEIKLPPSNKITGNRSTKSTWF